MILEWFKNGTNKSQRLINYLKFSFVLFLDRYIPDIQSPILFELSTVKSVSDRDQLRCGLGHVTCSGLGLESPLCLFYIYLPDYSQDFKLKKDESVLTFSCNSS